MSSYGELLAVLRQQSDVIGQIIDITTAERRAVANRDLPGLTAIATQKSALAEQLQQLEQRRSQIALTIAGDATSADSAPTLKELLTGATGPEAEQLRLLAQTLPIHLERMGDENRVNRQLIMSALGLVNSALDYLRPAGRGLTNYGPNPQQRRSPASTTTTTALDRRA